MSDVSLQSVWNPGLSFDLIPIPVYSPVLLPFPVACSSCPFCANGPVFFPFPPRKLSNIFCEERLFGVSLLLSSRMAACDHTAFVFAVIFYFPFYHFWPKNKTALFFHPVFFFFFNPEWLKIPARYSLNPCILFCF